MEPLEYFKSKMKDPEFAKSYGAERAQMELALALVDARSELGLTQKNMAQKLCLSQPYIAKLEKGKANPTIKQIGSMLARVSLRPTIKMLPLVAETPAGQTPGTVVVWDDAQIAGSGVFWGNVVYTGNMGHRGVGFVDRTFHTFFTAATAVPAFNLQRVTAVAVAGTPDPHDIENTVPIWSREGAAEGVA